MKKKIEIIEIVAHVTIQLILVAALVLALAPAKEVDAQYCFGGWCPNGSTCSINIHTCEAGCYCPYEEGCCATSYGTCPPDFLYGCQSRDCCRSYYDEYCDTVYGGCSTIP
jgi:hypothetical protein